MNEVLLLALSATGAILTGVWVLRPLGSRGASALSKPDPTVEMLIESKYAIYRSILDLELDRALGKVAEEDYHLMRAQYEADALEILGELDRYQSSAAGVDVLETEIAAARRRLADKT